MRAFDLSFSGPHPSPKPTPRRRPKHGRYIFSSRRINLATRSFKQILKCSTMADESKSRIQSVREWVVDHKLRTVGCLWLSGVTGSIAYNWSQPNMKTSVKIIHARLHAQALTLAALAGAALVEYYDHRTGAKAERVASFLESDAHTRRH